jgi:hypothetical protein
MLINSGKLSPKGVGLFLFWYITLRGSGFGFYTPVCTLERSEAQK